MNLSGQLAAVLPDGGASRSGSHLPVAVYSLSLSARAPARCVLPRSAGLLELIQSLGQRLSIDCLGAFSCRMGRRIVVALVHQCGRGLGVGGRDERWRADIAGTHPGVRGRQLEGRLGSRRHDG